MDPIPCDMCKKSCPNTHGYTKAYFSSTRYGGKLCGTECYMKWVLKCRKNKVKCIIPSPLEGEIKIVRTRVILNI
tara:strand:- start:750 stop:974 length:225 start_codon:yes stop_codon:yes gene_type:complete